MSTKVCQRFLYSIPTLAVPSLHVSQKNNLTCLIFDIHTRHEKNTFKQIWFEKEDCGPTRKIVFQGISDPSIVRDLEEK